MGKYIDTDTLKNANFRTGLGLKKFIDSLPEEEDVVKVTRCRKCTYFDPPTHDPQHPYGDMGVCKVYNMFKKPDGFCSDGRPKEGENSG